MNFGGYSYDQTLASFGSGHKTAKDANNTPELAPSSINLSQTIQLGKKLQPQIPVAPSTVKLASILFLAPTTTKIIYRHSTKYRRK
jgi:hypothetical protein